MPDAAVLDVSFSSRGSPLVIVKIPDKRVLSRPRDASVRRQFRKPMTMTGRMELSDSDSRESFVSQRENKNLTSSLDAKRQLEDNRNTSRLAASCL